MSDKWRQKLHLEPPQGWLNDPNGLSYYNGCFHVYFQYAPDSPDGGGRKCWGHYQSPDMLRWEFTGTVLVPDIPEDRSGVYSGSAIEKDGLLHIFYTGNVKEDGDFDYILNGRGANVIHVTTSDGCAMSEKKVVLRNSDYPAHCSCHVRDPKVWRENGMYRMVLGARTRDDKGCILFYSSPDLESWSFAGEHSVPNMGYMWECPDCFVIGGQKYISISPQGLHHEPERNQNVYSSGYFAGSEFIEWDHGFDFYAPQTFETPDGRRILIGWMGIGDIDYTNPTADCGWQHCLTLPRSLTRLSDGMIAQNPVKEYESLRCGKISAADGSKKSVPLPFDLCAKTDGDFEITMAGVHLRHGGGLFSIEFTDPAIGSGRDIRRARIGSCGDIRIIADMSSLEIYLDGGRYVMSTRYYPPAETITIGLHGINADLYTLRGMEVTIHGK